MSDSQPVGSALVAVGVIIVVIGGLVVVDGYLQQQMAQEWEEDRYSECFSRAADLRPEDGSPEEISLFIHERCGGSPRNEPVCQWRIQNRCVKA